MGIQRKDLAHYVARLPVFLTSPLKSPLSPPPIFQSSQPGRDSILGLGTHALFRSEA